MKWHQYQSNLASTGFVPKRTKPLTDPTWTRDVGAIGYASPVFGSDGTLYVATLAGKLVAVDPSNGQNVNFKKRRLKKKKPKQRLKAINHLK